MKIDGENPDSCSELNRNCDSQFGFFFLSTSVWIVPPPQLLIHARGFRSRFSLFLDPSEGGPIPPSLVKMSIFCSSSGLALLCLSRRRNNVLVFSSLVLCKASLAAAQNAQQSGDGCQGGAGGAA